MLGVHVRSTLARCSHARRALAERALAAGAESRGSTGGSGLLVSGHGWTGTGRRAELLFGPGARAGTRVRHSPRAARADRACSEEAGSTEALAELDRAVALDPAVRAVRREPGPGPDVFAEVRGGRGVVPPWPRPRPGAAAGAGGAHLRADSSRASSRRPMALGKPARDRGSWTRERFTLNALALSLRPGRRA